MRWVNSKSASPELTETVEIKARLWAPFSNRTFSDTFLFDNNREKLTFVEATLIEWKEI